MPRTVFVAFAVCLFVCLPGSTLYAAAPPSAQGAAARAQAQGLEAGRAAFLTIGNAAKAEAIGLSGMKAGQKVKVEKTGDGRWRVTDPATERSVTVDQAPDLGQ